ncbi:Pimeloyl-ACP methyl ester carboxylesterase [Nakamurella panacisegetis]|uniref:Pimeloyl-ACP methyl ester carboxylesterase n=1 Tax=Nakamurella panacisegetis TaxID=1090615 RepID=A0A1H0QP52_9ACTN|nr:alpha/beta hydrolase [Nakamurella panacisegetis]SDP18519.1 Pimeloyl-ACP methyl ester carboxylesterase [Nakamurella panacisegetis]
MSSTTSPVTGLQSSHTNTFAAGGVEITFYDHDRARVFLLLHGGAGAGSVRGFADLLAERTRSRVLVPTHPGFGGTARPEDLTTTRDLAAAYVALLDELDLTDVTVVGNSFGGWIAAEMALLASPRVSSAVIVDGIGIEVDGHPMTDVGGLAPADLAALAFHDPAKAPRPPAGAAGGPSPDVAAIIGYAGPTMSDPSLLDRLSVLDVPVHVVWGQSDGVVGLDYGRAYADAIPTATFTVLPRSGHLPQLETPEELLRAITEVN